MHTHSVLVCHLFSRLCVSLNSVLFSNGAIDCIHKGKTGVMKTARGHAEGAKKFPLLNKGKKYILELLYLIRIDFQRSTEILPVQWNFILLQSKQGSNGPSVKILCKHRHEEMNTGLKCISRRDVFVIVEINRVRLITIQVYKKLKIIF